MFYIKVSSPKPVTQLIRVEMSFELKQKSPFKLQWPSWRPGRYELANFAQNLYKLKAQQEGVALECNKAAKDVWEISPNGKGEVTIRFDYYASQPDAGGSWVDEDIFYINFINCIPYIPGREDDTYQLELDVPQDFEIACGLQHAQHRLMARNYYELVDSPVMAARKLNHWQYKIDRYNFHIWVCGDHQLSKDKVIQDFKKFTTAQMKIFGEFPVRNYHYMIWLQPFKAYHGVEHGSSTMIVFGPGDKAHEEKYYKELLGVSSHELFHTWNVTRIRPKEMMPYDFSCENYHETGFLTEGFTTYYGDLMLMRSGIFGWKQYQQELHRLIDRHFTNQGRHAYSLTESSYDLWLDGYKKGAPNRKVSIYIKGALVALTMDLTLRSLTDGLSSLDSYMYRLWEEWDSTDEGYTLQQAIKLFDKISDQEDTKLAHRLIRTSEPMEGMLSDALDTIGCTLVRKENPDCVERKFGLSVNKSGKVMNLALSSPAHHILNYKDVILRLNGYLPEELDVSADINQLEVSFERMGKHYTQVIESSEKCYFPIYRVRKIEKATPEQKEHFKAWSGHAF